MYFKLDTVPLITSAEAQAEYNKLCKQYADARKALFDFLIRMTDPQITPAPKEG